MTTNTVLVFLDTHPDKPQELVAYCKGKINGEEKRLWIDGGDAAEPSLFELRVIKLVKMYYGIEKDAIIFDEWQEEELGQAN